MESNKYSDKEIKQSIKKAKSVSGLDTVKRWVPSIIILPIATYWVLNRGEFGLLDNIDLVIHPLDYLSVSFYY